jgi:hypothetical protein
MINIEFAPEKMDQVVVSSESNCQVRLAWIEPANGGSSLTQFVVKVQGSSQQFYRVPECGQDPTQTSCSLPMSTFASEPFLL